MKELKINNVVLGFEPLTKTYSHASIATKAHMLTYSIFLDNIFLYKVPFQFDHTFKFRNLFREYIKILHISAGSFSKKIILFWAIGKRQISGNT
jgi:hypothetical protein